MSKFRLLARNAALLAVVLMLTGAIAVQPNADPESDKVGATAGHAEVTQAGAATYEIPIFTTPGTAGVAPKLSLAYSSQGGDGPMGRGWSISGTSSITRCRAAREQGDFVVNGQPVDGDAGPINMTASDRFCLDGQRLIPAPTSALPCKTLAGFTATAYRTEIESFQRVCGYVYDASKGPRFFTVERKDGSTSWYGDRRETTGGELGPRTDGSIEYRYLVWSTDTGETPTGILFNWAQTRFQDSSGNYIDYSYLVNSSEQLLSQVAYTGKKTLPGQAGSDSTPYANIDFHYDVLPAAYQTWGYLARMQTYRIRGLASVSVYESGYEVRHYALTYATSPSGSNAQVLTSVQECATSTKAICYPATTFDWSQASNKLQFEAEILPRPSYGSLYKFDGYKLGDIDGDGLQDMVRLYDGNCATEQVIVGFGKLDANGRPGFEELPASPQCTATELEKGLGPDSWFLFDYDGDGKDDLFMAGSPSYVLLRSLGRPASGTSRVFDSGNNLISSLVPAPSSKSTLAELADLNGDGLLDVVYPRGAAFYARLMERSGTSYAWGGERTIVFAGSCGVGSPYTCSTAADVLKANGGYQLYDFDGDSRSDLLFSMACSGNCFPHGLGAFRVDTIGASTITLKNYGFWDIWTGGTSASTIGTYSDLRFADFNGDGLTDALFKYYKSGTNGFWTYSFNTGAYFGPARWVDNNDPDTNYTITPGNLQISDLNGDGRADLVYASPYTDDIHVRYATSSGTFAGEAGLGGAGTPLVSLTGCGPDCLSERVFMFSDFDGDGATDMFHLRIGGDGNYNLWLYRSAAASRYKPRDTLTAATDGLGARTEFEYLPLSLNGVYRRENGSRNDSASYGRGSPVRDVDAPMYVVTAQRTDAPNAQDAAAKHEVRYRYAGARMQAGGRGFLGFREVTSIDASYPGETVATTTAVSQRFPLVGMPVSSTVTVVDAPYVADSCGSAPATGNFTFACFKDRNQPFSPVGGSAHRTVVSAVTNAWEPATFDVGVQQPLQVRLAGTDAASFDLATAARNSRVATAFNYDAWGNALQSSVDTYTGAADTNPVRKVTTSTYLNDEANWRLGRMDTSSVAHTRTGVTITRNTKFGYAMSGPATGLLTSERIQPNGNARQDFRTEYDLDAYGNRIGAYSCSQDIATCVSTAPVISTWNTNLTIHRYTTQAFDYRGRYLVSTSEPFRKPLSAWGTGERVNTVTRQILGRDLFGNVTQAVDLNGVNVAAAAGAMGRPYWNWTQTVPNVAVGDPAGGIDAFKTYRRCGTVAPQVSCPAGAAFRERVSSDGAATRWTYFDRLGRSVLTVAESFNAGVANADLSAVCTWYDSAGRASGVSTPFFLPGTEASGDPAFATNPCVQASRDVTYTFYDVLGRPTRVVGPDGGVVAMAYAGLTTTTTNQKSQHKIETKDAAGHLVASTDELGLTTTYDYDATGNLTKVMRNAGRGVIQTTMVYDALGRKTGLVDPDAGTISYAYNPAGEVVSETQDGVWRGRRYDFKGRLIWEGNTLVYYTFDEAATYRYYDEAAHGLGQLASVATSGNYLAWKDDPTLAVDHSVGYSYDALGRRIASTTLINGTAYSEATGYDSLGRGYKSQDATGRWAKSEYSGRGFVVRTCESSAADQTPGCVPNNTSTYYETLATDARGNTLKDRRGGSVAMTGTRTYDPFTGALKTICTGDDANGCQVVNERYTWDAVGNLLTRSKASYAEEFSYDGLNRLTQSRFSRLLDVAYLPGTGPINGTQSYDALGNICSRLIQGATKTYQYAGASGCGLNGLPGSGTTNLSVSPHAVSALGGGNGQVETQYGYDYYGNQTTADRVADNGNDRTIAYTMSDQAHEIRRGSRATRFWYAGDGSRYMRDDLTYSGTTYVATRTITVGNVEFMSGPNGALTRRYVAGVLVQETPAGGSPINRYFHFDHLGSVVALTNYLGAVLERYDYSPFGERRDPNNPVLARVSATYTKRGYTGHEMVDFTDVVHMNGRIYDPSLGRFLQVDPVIQDPTNGQNFDRYTYVWNNPLAYTDPTGMISVKNLIRQIVGIYLSAWLGSNENIFGQYAGGAFANAVGSVVGSYVSGGKNGIGLTAAFEFDRAPDVLPSSDPIASPEADKYSDGADSEVQKQALNLPSDIGPLKMRSDGVYYLPGRVTRIANERATNAIADLMNQPYDDSPERLEWLAKELAIRLQPFQMRYHTEFGVRIFRGAQGLYVGSAMSNGTICTEKAACDTDPSKSESNFEDGRAIAWFHTHPFNYKQGGGWAFSTNDLEYSRGGGWERAFVSLPDGTLYMFVPNSEGRKYNGIGAEQQIQIR